MATDWRKSTEEFKAAMAGAVAAPETETGGKQKASREDKAMDRRAAENDARRDDLLTGRGLRGRIQPQVPAE